jgi:succinylarginine dihydrolase
VALTDDEAAAMHQGVIMTEALYAKLVPWVEKHYRDHVEPKDLADPQLAIECAPRWKSWNACSACPGCTNWMIEQGPEAVLPHGY